MQAVLSEPVSPVFPCEQGNLQGIRRILRKTHSQVAEKHKYNSVVARNSLSYETGNLLNVTGRRRPPFRERFFLSGVWRRLCHSDETWVVDLVDCGILSPDGETISEGYFLGTNIALAKKPRWLTGNLGLNTAGVAMVLDLLAEPAAILG